MLLEALDVKPGQVVCDMGCGNGFYTLQLANWWASREKCWPSISNRKCCTCSRSGRKAADWQYRAVEGHWSIPSCPRALDLILLVDVYHEFSHPRGNAGSDAKGPEAARGELPWPSFDWKIPSTDQTAAQDEQEADS